MYYTKTKNLLEDLHSRFIYESWADVPEDDRNEIRAQFFLEMPESEIAEYICHKLTSYDCAKLVNSISDRELINFANSRLDALIDRSDDTLEDLFYETKPSYSERQEQLNEQKSFTFGTVSNVADYFSGVQAHA